MDFEIIGASYERGGVPPDDALKTHKQDDK